MPEYLAPGVYIEEVSFRQKPIEGVSTSTSAFVGPTRDGPIFGEPPLVTSLQEFSEIYGGLDPLEYDGAPFVNFVAQAVRAYFEEGGKRLYVARVFEPLQGDLGDAPQLAAGNWSDGIARWSIDDDASVPGTPPDRITLRARYPGAAGNRLVTLRFYLGSNILVTDEGSGERTLRGVTRFDTAWVLRNGQTSGALFWIDRVFDPQGRPTFRLRQDDPAVLPPAAGTITDLDTLAEVRVLTASVSIEGRGRFRGRFDLTKTFENLTFHPAPLSPAPTRSLVEAFPRDPTHDLDRTIDTPSRRAALYSPIVVHTSLTNGADVARALAQRINVANSGTLLQALDDFARGGTPNGESPPRLIPVTEEQLSVRLELRGGNDGQRPDAGDYGGIEDTVGTGTSMGLLALEDLEDISILAAPGASYGGLNGYGSDMRSITGLLLSHCDRMRYRVAVLDSPDGALPGEVREQRASLDSKYGALYYPWVLAFDPITEIQMPFPPSGFVAGIYARNDVERGVHKAPANEVVRLATGFELLLNKGQQEVLNPLGVNCLRYFEGRGFRIWGARTITSDPEWKYINLRRNFAYLGRSIEIGTQWAVFEPNAEELWANVRRSVEDFLYNEWKNGRLMGVEPDEAFFVRCDRTTMTQSDIDNGRLVCLIGVALLRPAEFVIFRIGQKTLDFKG
jgi:phage tail sheath protein FI